MKLTDVTPDDRRGERGLFGRATIQHTHTNGNEAEEFVEHMKNR